MALPLTRPDNARLTGWMEATAQGDAAAFRHLAKALGGSMYAQAIRLSNGDSGTAEDVVQDVLVKLWQTAPRWESGGSVGAYVSRLIYTTAMDYYRKRLPTTDEVPEVAAPETINRDMDLKEKRKLVLDALMRLPERQREAVNLAYFHEYRSSEVARAMGTTEKAVESLLVRARRTLAGHLPENLMEG